MRVPPQALPLRSDLAIIAGWIAPGSRVLDLGCGDGALLAHLRDARSCRGYGVDIDDANVLECVRRGVNVVQSDLDVGLRMFTDDRSTPWCCRRRCRRCTASRTCCARWRASRATASSSFPNFGHWKHAWSLLPGRMPVTRQIPYQWYDTPNIHLCTPQDFEALAAQCGLTIIDHALLAEGRRVDVLPALRATLAIYRFAAPG